ncbi:MAG TPA: hypothetical protein VEJ87_06160, partial [Acidimicrobiales bacterium]|nr:hypothetical protein [Acidimicrobiales bacterium]
QEATERVFDFHASEFFSQTNRDIAWIALAVTQWKLGRLLPDVRSHALRVIDSGDDLERWPPEDRAGRQRALQKTRELLLSSQRSPTRVPRPMLDSTPYEVGDLLTYSHPSGREVATWIFEIRNLERAIGKQTTPSYQVAALGSPKLTGVRAIEEAGPPLFKRGQRSPATLQFHLLFSSDTGGGRWQRIGSLGWRPDEVPSEFSGVVQTRPQRSERLANWHVDRVVDAWYKRLSD